MFMQKKKKKPYAPQIYIFQNSGFIDICLRGSLEMSQVPRETLAANIQKKSSKININK
jgi:hypothetical protein